MKGQTIERPRGKVGFLCGRNRDALRSVLVAMLVLITLATYANAQTGGTWTPLTNAFKGGYPDAALLLTDGTVLVHDGYSLRDWYKLTPDAFGSYINGQWSQVASIPNTFDYAPLFFFSAVLPTGQVIIEGSEYNFTVTQYPDHGAIYDPVKDSWTQVFPPDFGDTCAQDGTPGGGTYWCSVGESPSGVLPDGSFLVSDASDTTSSGLSKLEALLPPPYTGPWIQTGFGKRDRKHRTGFYVAARPTRSVARSAYFLGNDSGYLSWIWWLGYVADTHLRRRAGRIVGLARLRNIHYYRYFPRSVVLLWETLRFNTGPRTIRDLRGLG